MKLKITLIIVILVLLSCSVLGASETCLNVKSKNIHSLLVSQVDKSVCVFGRLIIEPHFIYFKTASSNSLYAGKIYLPINYAEAIRSDLKNNQCYEYSGILTLRKNSSKCEDAQCYSYYLKNESEHIPYVGLKTDRVGCG